MMWRRPFSINIIGIQIDNIFRSSCSTKTMVPNSKTVSFPPSTKISTSIVNSTQLKFQNFDSEITQLISGLKSNLKKDSEEPLNVGDDKLMLDNDDEPLEMTPAIRSNEQLVVSDSSEKQIISSGESAIQVNLSQQPLADIIINLDDIRPHDDYAPRCILDEKSGLKIMLNFTKDKPRADVAVLVITTMNQNSLPIRNFQFEASVPKVSIS